MSWSESSFVPPSASIGYTVRLIPSIKHARENELRQPSRFLQMPHTDVRTRRFRSGETKKRL